jgi:hypothetical protein
MTFGTPSSLVRLVAMATISGLALTACSGGADEASTTAPNPSASTSASPEASPSGEPQTSESPAPSGSPEPTKIIAVLCDPATDEQVAAIEAVLDPEFTLSQVIDVRRDDEKTHAILGFVEGPGLSVLAQWTGEGLSLEGLASVDDFAAQVTDAPKAGELDADTQELVDQTVACYSAIHAPEDGDDKKKDDKNAE